MSSMYASASSSTFNVPLSPPKPADFFRTAMIDSRFSLRNFRPCSRVCSFCDPRLKTAAQMTRIIAASKSQCLFNASWSSISGTYHTSAPLMWRRESRAEHNEDGHFWGSTHQRLDQDPLRKGLILVLN